MLARITVWLIVDWSWSPIQNQPWSLVKITFRIDPIYFRLIHDLLTDNLLFDMCYGLQSLPFFPFVLDLCFWRHSLTVVVMTYLNKKSEIKFAQSIPKTFTLFSWSIASINSVNAGNNQDTAKKWPRKHRKPKYRLEMTEVWPETPIFDMFFDTQPTFMLKLKPIFLVNLMNKEPHSLK